MSTYVVHPIWPVKTPTQMQYGLFRIGRSGEKEIARGELDELSRCQRQLMQLQHGSAARPRKQA